MARSPSRVRDLAGLAAALALSMTHVGHAASSERPSLGRRMLERAGALVEAASAARIPPLRPPTPVPVTWKAKRLGSVDLGAPLVTLASGDLDGDGRAELVAVTETEVVVLAPQGKRAVAAVARAPLPADPPDAQPRAPVATAVVAVASTGAELHVRSSSAARGARYRYQDGRLREVGVRAAFPLCVDRDGALARGRNYFERDAGDGLPVAWPSRYWSAVCRTGLVDREGRSSRVDAVLGARGALTVTVAVRCAAGDAGCVPERTLAIADAGVALAVADVNRDGRPEVITSAATAPGDADAVTVHSLPASGTKLGKPVFSRKFSGGVGGLAADDLDGDGDTEVIAAVRLSGAERVDLWLLD